MSRTRRVDGTDEVKQLVGNVLHGLYQSVDTSKDDAYAESVFEHLKENCQEKLIRMCKIYLMD